MRTKPKFIQVQATRGVAHGDDSQFREIERCAPADADMYSVYEGEGGDFRWLTDFGVSLGKHEAMQWAQSRAMRLGAQLLDQTEM